MAEIKDTVYVDIEYFSGHGEGDDGVPYYVASSHDLHFVTEGQTFEEMLANVRECLALLLQDGDSVAEFGVSSDATVKLVMQLPENYVQTT